MSFTARYVSLFGFICFLAACGGGGGSTTPPPSVPAPSNLSYSSPQQFTAGQAIAEITPSVTGSVTSYSVSPALPQGLSLDAATGHISGTPQSASAQANYVITASNAAGSTSFAIAMTVLDAESFWSEPTAQTTIAINQTIALYAAFQKSSDPYPRYLDPASLSYESTNSAAISIDSQGYVTGLSEGTSTVTVSDQTHTAQTIIVVSGRMTRRTISVANQGNRDYWIYVPAFATNNAHPAIVSMHGGGGTAMLQASTTQLNELAASQDIYIVYLEGSGVIQTFNAGGCCGSAQTQNIDDVLYVSRVLDDVNANFAVDTTKTFATGFSNGAMMSHRLACALSDRISGIAAVSGGSAEFDKDGNQYFVCNPQRPIPVLHIHALNDRNYPYEGGTGAGISGSNFYSIDATIHDWTVRNNVTDAARAEQVTSTTTCYHHETPADTSKPSAPVVLCKLDPADVFDPVNNIVFGGGHSWPGGVKSLTDDSDVPNAEFDAKAYLWKFFSG